MTVGTSFICTLTALYFAVLGRTEAFRTTTVHHRLPLGHPSVGKNVINFSSPRKKTWNGGLHSLREDDEDPPLRFRDSFELSFNQRNMLSIATMLTVTSFAMNAFNKGPFMTADSFAAFIDTISNTGFYQAFSLVFVSEIFDKSFFIAGILSMKAGKLISFLGSVGALALVTLISVAIGQFFHTVPAGIPEGIPYDDVATVLAFTFFGLNTLKETLDNDIRTSNIGDEFADAEEMVEGSQNRITTWGKIASTFGLVFAAEFGDRSFFSTIALSAAQAPGSVAAGAIVAHAIATGFAVAGGSYFAEYVSERTIGLIGGTLFLVFAVTTAVGLF